MNRFWHECSTNNENLDTYRILGTETISMLGEDGEDGGSRWCQVISLLETSVSLERNPTRLLLVQALLQKAKATSGSLHGTTVKASAGFVKTCAGSLPSPLRALVSRRL